MISIWKGKFIKIRDGLITLLLMAVSTPSAVAVDATMAAQLRCEYLQDPLGIDVTQPRLSWILTSDQRGQKQTAYQVLVASTPDLLAKDQGDLWDSGKVVSDQSIQVEYVGRPLESRMRCFWKVRVWGANMNLSAWSQPALWTIGLLHPKEWEAAKWIGEEKRAPGYDSEAYQWIWYPEGKPNQVAPAGTRYFRRKFSVPGGKKIAAVTSDLTCDNGFTLYVNGVQAGQGANWSQPPKLDIKEHLTPGVNTLAIAAINESSAAGLTGKFAIQFDDNTSLVIGMDPSWKTSNQEMSNWKADGFDDSAWQAAMVLGPMGMAPWGVVQWNSGVRTWVLPPSPYLRKEFPAEKPIRRATLYATALGTYQLHINGTRVGQDYFNPGWTEFRKRVYYQTYDVTQMLRQGTNAIGAVLSDGWYSGYIWSGRDTYGTQPKLRAQIEIEYADGTLKTVATDETWKLSYGPIREGDVQQGETYDARLEMPGWDAAAFDCTTWQPVSVATVPHLQLGVSPCTPVRKQQEFKPVRMTEPRPGVYVFDLGQNIAGWSRIKAKGPRGTKVVLRISGWLNPDGTIYTDYLRDARAIDTYYLKGGGEEEVWEPSTTYHGFQYVEVTGYPGTPTLDDITGIECNSTLPTTGTFECSDARVNKLYSNLLRTMRDNLVDIPTGDSDRAERLGWCAKTPLVNTWTYALGMGGFLSKWMVDLVDSQSLSANENGAAFMQVAPFWGDVESPGWSDDGIAVPYGLYKAYGDTGIIRKHYDAMARYLGYIQSKLVNNLRPANLGIASDPKFVGYGDWLAITQNREGNADIFNTLLNGASVKMMAEMAEAIGRTSDAAAYRELFGKMQTAFDHAYVSSQGVVRDDSQMEYALALYYGFIPADKQSMAISNLANDILNKCHQQTFPDAKGNNPSIPAGHLTTGFHGSRALLPVLSEYGRNDVAYDLLLADTYPSWLYPVKLGATTTWERWDSWTPEKGFQDPRMNSFSMPDLMASVGEWLFHDVGGIGQHGEGFKNIVIKPYVGAGLNWAGVSYDSMHGTIAVRWEKNGGNLVVTGTIPANTSATVSLPGSGPGPFTITESSKPLWSDGAYVGGGVGISGASENRERIDVAVGSGTYRFSVTGGGK